MNRDPVLQISGLVTQYNPYSTKKGALITANEAVIRRENVVEKRRGYGVYMALSNNPTKLLVYNNRVLCLNSTTMSYDSDGSGTRANYAGTYSAPTSYNMRYVEANSNLYVTTNSGIKVFQDLSGTQARDAGAPRALDPSYALTGSSGFLADNSQCAYRCVVVRTDLNGNVLYGYPSQRLWVSNSAGASRNVIITLYLSSNVVAGDVIQFYRTEQVVGVSTDSAGDECGLVYQYTLTSSDISTGFITFTDQVVDLLIGTNLYTNPSQQGIVQGNDPPPLSKAIELYKSQFMFYANTSTKQSLYFSMVGTASLSGKTITLAGVTYNFGATEIVSGAGSPQAKVSATGVASTDIDQTARSLVRVINRYASNTSVYAYYLSGPDDLPGKILIQERGLGASAFTVQASDTAISGMFFPAPPVGTTNSQSTSSNSVNKNYVYYSKAQELEHVPSLNYFPVGPANKDILALVALRDSLIIVKEEGVYRLTGDTAATFSVQPLDLTVFCKAQDSISRLANTVVMLSNQGVVSISDTGVEVISHDIEPNILPLLTYSGISTAIGQGYESERQYLLSVIGDSTQTTPSQTFVYNIFTKAWTRWGFGITGMAIPRTTDKLFFIKNGSSNVYRERKDFANTDYSDPESAITIVSVDRSAKQVTFTFSSGTPDIGWAIKQGIVTNPIVSVVQGSSSNWVATLANTPPASWTAGAATIYPSIAFEIVWDAWTAGDPGTLKQVSEVKFITDNIPGNNTCSNLYATFRTDLDPSTTQFSFDTGLVGWGSGPWGSMPWGGRGTPPGYRFWVPARKQYCAIMNVGIRHKRANEKLAITGVEYLFSPVSERVSK